MAGVVRFERTTIRLTAESSAVELHANKLVPQVRIELTSTDYKSAVIAIILQGLCLVLRPRFELGIQLYQSCVITISPSENYFFFKYFLTFYLVRPLL